MRASTHLKGSALACVIAACITAALTACTGADRSDAKGTAASGDWSVAARIAMPGIDPFQVDVGYGYVWVVLRGPRGCTKSVPCSLARIDPRTNRVVGKPTPLDDPWELAVGAGSVWVNDFNGSLTRVDVRTGQVQARIEAPPLYFGSAIAFGGGSIWTGNDDERNKPQSVAKVDPKTNRVAGTVGARSPQSITYGDGAVWLADHAGELVKIDPKTMKVLARTRLDFGPHGVIATRDRIYVADAHGHRLFTADPKTGRITHIKELSIGPIYPVLGGGSLWTTSEVTWEDPSQSDDRVVRIDPESLRIQQTIHLRSSGTNVAFGFGSAWVALRSGDVVRLTR